MTQSQPKAEHSKATNGSGHRLHAIFSAFAQKVSKITGQPTAFLLAVLVVVVWAISGPLFDYSDTWQLVINTGTTIVTFLMVFLIQNTQNRDTLALQLKVSELALGMKGVSNSVAAIEDLSDDELEALHNECRRRAEHTFAALTDRRSKAAKPSGKTAGKTPHKTSGSKES
jgi:low affinity Fe/Cu permease